MAIGNGIGVPFGKNAVGGGGGGFAFGNSYHFDGVNDNMNEGGTDSSTCFNPFNQTDWTAAMWLKPDGSAFNHNTAPFGCGRYVNDAGFGSVVFFNGTAGGNIVRVYSNLYNATFTYEIPAATLADWFHLAVTVEMVDASNQEAKIYINGDLKETKTFTNYNLVDTSISFRLGGWNNNSSFINAYMNQPVFQESLLSATDISDLYNGGRGANASDIMTTMKSGYLGTEAVGTTTGIITDVTGNQDLTMSGFVAPYGVVSDTP